MKMKIQLAIIPLRMSGAVMSTNARSRVAPKMRLASSSSGRRRIVSNICKDRHDSQ